MTIKRYPPDQQGSSYFGRGEITELRAISFPGEKGAVTRVGPLFYWAWAYTNETYQIPEHPHKGFEIVTYVLVGEVEHGDSLTHHQHLSAGSLQIIQAGSGVKHTEKLKKDTELLHIWFEPDLRQSFKQVPTYSYLTPQQVMVTEEQIGVRVKHLIGSPSPIELQTKATMIDVEIAPNQRYIYQIPADTALAFYVTHGRGNLDDVANGDHEQLKCKDFVVVEEDTSRNLLFQANNDGLRIVVIEVPNQVPYSLYHKE